MSAKLVQFKTSERSDRGLVDTKVGGTVDIEVGTSGTYKPFDADLETSGDISQHNTSDLQPSGFGSASGNASITMDLGTSSSVGGVGITGGRFQSSDDGGNLGKGLKHQRDSSSDSSSSSSSDEGDKESAKAKRKKKKKRKGILSGNFLSKFGASKKSSKKDDSYRTPLEVGPGLTPPSGNVDRPRSAEVQIQAAFDSPEENTRDNQDDGSRPDVEIFSGIGADGRANTGQSREEKPLPESSKDDLGQGPQGAGPGSHDSLEVDVACGEALSPEASPPSFVRVTVTASSVDKFPPPELRPVDDGTDVDIGFSAQLDGEFYDPSVETMDTTDLLSQIENTINSIEAAQQQNSGSTFTSELEINVDPTSSVSANINPHSVDIPAVDDLETSGHIHLPEPKDGPILELPEDTQGLAGSNLLDVDVDRTVPDASVQISSERESHSPSSSSRSSTSEKGAKSKNIFPSLKFNMPKRGGKKSPDKVGDPGNISIDAAAENNVVGSVPSQPDLVVGASDVSMGVDRSQVGVDQDQKNDLSLDTSFNITGTSDYSTPGKDVNLGGGLNVNAGIHPSNISSNKKDELERDDSSDIDAYLGGATVVALPSVDREKDEAKSSLDADAKTTSKGKPKKGKLKMPKFKKFGSKKAGSDVDVPKVGAVIDMDIEKPDAESDIDVEISVSDGPSRPSFEVVGKRASLKRDVDGPNIEMPVSQEVQLVVESKPQGDFEVSLPTVGGGDHTDDVGPFTSYGRQENGVNGRVDGKDDNLGLYLDGNLSVGVEVDGPERHTLKDALNVRGASEMDDSSDIEAYLDPPEVATSPATGYADVNMSIENPDTWTRVKAPYTKGKVYRKGNRNTPKFKSKPNYGVKAGMTSADIHSPNVTLSSDVDKRGPSGDFEMEVQSPGAEASTESFLQTPKADVKASVSEPNLVYDGEAKRKGFTLPRLKMPKFKKKSRKSSKDKTASGSFHGEKGGYVPSGAKISASSSMPDISYGAKGQADFSGQVRPDFEGPHSPSSPHVDTDEKKKKRWSGNFKFPSFGLPKFGGRKKSQSGSEGHDISSDVDVTFNKPQVKGVPQSKDNSMDIDGNLDVFPGVDTEVKDFKKGGGDFDTKIEADVDKTSDKVGIGVNIDTDLPNIEGNIDFVTIDGQNSSLPQPEHDAELEVLLNSAINPSAKMPSVQMQGVVDEDDFAVNKIEDNVKLPHVSAGMGGGVDPLSGDFEIDIPKGQFEIDKGDHDRDISASVDREIALQGGGFDIGGDIHTPRGDIEAPGGEFDMGVRVGGNIDLPEVGIKMEGDGDDKSVSSSSSSSSSEGDEKKKKKGFFGSLHLPKFGGKGRTKKPKGLEIDIEEGDDVGFKIDKPKGTVDVDVRDIEAGAEVITPDVRVSHKEIKSDFDVDIPKPVVELPDVDGNISGKVELPSGDVVGDIPTGKIDVDAGDQDVEISGNIDGDIDLPRGDFDIRGDTHAPKGEVEAPSGEVCLDVGVGGNIDMPEMGIKMKGDGDDKSVSSSSSSSSSESDEKKKKKGFFGSLHLPKFGGKGRTKKSIGTGVSFDQDDDAMGTLDRPQVKGDIDQGDIDIGAEVVMPDVSVSQKNIKPDIDVDISKPEADFPEISNSIEGKIDVPSGGFEAKTPEERIGIDMDDQDVHISGKVDGDIDVPRADFDFGNDIHVPRGGIEAPSGKVDIDAGVGGNFDVPEVGIKLKGDGDDKSVTSSSTDNSEKKKKKGFFGSLHLPKFGGKGSTKKSIGTGVSFDLDNEGEVDVDKPQGNIDMDHGDANIGAEVVMPEMSIMPDKVEPGMDVDISKPSVDIPDASVDVIGRIDLPSGELEVDIPKGRYGNGKGDRDVDISGNVDVDLDGAEEDIGIRGDIRAPRGDIEFNSGETDFDVSPGGNIRIPEVGVKMKSDGDDRSLTSSSSSSSTESDEKKKKKGFFGSLHLPKFGGKGRTKKSKDRGIDVEDRGDIAISLDKPTVTVDVDEGDFESRTEIVTPDVSVSQKEINSDFDLDISKPDVELPDMSGNIGGKVELPSGDVVADIPTGVVDVSTGDQDVEISGNVDGNIDLPRGDFDIRGDIHAPKGEVEASSGEVCLDVGVGGNIDMPEMGIKMKGDGDDKSVSSSSSSSSLESDEKKKKKGFFGSLHLPKFGGKGRTKKSIGTGVSFDQGDDVEIDVDKPQLNVDLDGGDVDIDADVVVPEMSVKPKEMKPDVDVDISKPDISSPGGMSSDMEGKVDLPGVDVELDIPTSKIVFDKGDDDVNISGNVGGDIDVPVEDLGIGGGMHAPRGDVEAPSGEIDLDVGVGGNIDLPEVGFKLKGDGDDKSVSSSSSSSSESDEKKKKKGFFGSLHLPRFGGKGHTKKPKGPGVDIETGDDIAFSLDKPTGTVDVDEGDIAAGAEIVSPEVNVSQKDMKHDIDMDISKADVDQPEVSVNIDERMDVPRDEFEVEIPKGKFDIDTGDQDVDISGNIDRGIDLPRGDIDIGDDINAPRGEIDIPGDEVRLDVGVGGKIYMPEAGIKVKRDGDDKSVTSSSSSSSSEVGEKKKKGFFGSLHLPKFGGKGRTKKHIGTGGSFDRGNDVVVDVDKPHLNVDLDGGDADIGGELVKPEMSVMSKDSKAGIDVDISKPIIHSPDVSNDMKWGVDLPSSEVEADIPKRKMDIDKGDHDVDASGKVDGEFAVQSGGLDIGGDIHTPRGDMEAQGGEFDIGVGAGGNIDLPEVGIKMKGDGDDKSVSSSSSSSSSEGDEKKKKKGFFGSLHLPKFGGKGRTKKSKGLEVDIEEGDDVGFKLDKPKGTVDVNVRDIEAGAEIITPDVSVSQREMKSDFDADVPKPVVELPDVDGNISGKLELPSGDVVGDIPTGKIDVDAGDQDVEISGNIDGDIDLPRGDFDIGGDIHAPKGEAEAPSGEVCLDVGVGGNIDMPEMGIKMKGDGDDKSVSSSSSSSSSESDEKKKKKGFFGSLHLPKFGGKGRTKKSIGTGVSFDQDDDAMGTLDRPQVNSDMDQGDIDIGAEVVMPDVSVSQKNIKPDIDVDISEADLPDVSGGVVRGTSLPSGDVEVNFPTGKIDIDTGKQDVDISANFDEDIDLPRGDSGFEGDINAPGGNFEAPSGQVGLDVGVGGNIDVPEVVIKAKGDGDDKSVTSSSSSSSSESDQKKKKKGFFGSLHLPKFGGKGQTKKLDADLKGPEGNVNLDLEQVDAGTNADIPDMSVGVNDIKADVDLDVSKPKLEVPDAAVELGREDAEIDVPIGGVDVGVGHGNVELPEGSLHLDKDVVVNLPDADVHPQKPYSDMSLDGKVKAGVSVGGDIDPDGQDISVGLPRFGVESKGEGDDKSVTSSSSSEEEKKGKKGLFGGLHLPKLGFPKRAKRKSGSLDRGDGVDVNLDEYINVSADPNQVDINPEVSVEVQADKGDVNIYQPEVEGSLDDPDMHIAAGIPCGDALSDLKIDHGAPDVDLTIRGAPDLRAEGDMDLPEKVGVGIDGPERNVEGSLQSPNIGQPKVDVNEVEIGTDKPRNLVVDVPKPAEITGPGVSFGVDGKPDTGANSKSSPSSSEDEEEKETPTKKKKKGILPFHLPKIQLKRPKSPEKKKGLSPANVEVELKTDVDVPDTDVAGAVVTGVDISGGSHDLDQPNIEVSGSERNIDLGPEIEEPEMSVSVASSDKPKLNLSVLGGVNEPDLDINADANVDIGTDVDIGFDGSSKAGMDQDVAVPELDVGIHRANTADGSDDDINFEKFGKMLGEATFGDLDMGDSLEVNIGQDQEENIEVEGEVPVFQVNKDLHADFDLNKQLGLELAADEGGDASLTPSDFNAGIGLSRSSSKSSVSSSSSEEEVKPKKSKGFLPSLKFPKLTSGKGPGKEEAPRADGRGNIPVEVEENIAPSVTVNVESAPPKVETKSPKGKLGLFKKGKGKKSDSPKSLRSDSEVQVDQGPDTIVPSVNVSLESTPPKLKAELELPSASSTPGQLDLSGAIAAHSMPTTPQPTSPSTPHSFSVVVAIDFGTTFSGYAYSFTEEPDDIHVMRKWEGGDPGVINMKTLTTLLLTPEGEFHSFGFSARDFYHDMNFTEAQKWLYFDKYKLTLHDDQNLNIETELVASNGTRVKALTVFTHTLKFFKDHFLEELMDLSVDDGPIDEGEIRWVLTVPAIWRQPAKQFMRQAAYQAGIASPLMPNQLLIALEPEAASIYIGKLSMKQLMPERMALKRERWLRGSMGKGNDPNMKVIDELKQGSRYLVVDCGGGTVDITVHEWEQDSGTLKELHKASGGTFGSINVDEAFISLLVDIFGKDFIEEFKIKRPAGWVDLLLAFEARKRNANPWKANYLNVSLPFSFIDYYKKFTNGNLTVDKTLTEYNSRDVSWCGEAPGMLRFSQDGMFKLFKPTTNRLLAKLDQVLEKPELGGISHIFLAGGFAESPLLQHQLREKYKDRLRVVIPQEVGLATLKGAVMYGQNPKAVSVRRTRLTYGVGALNKFNPQVHPEEKKIVKDGKEWCKDVFDVFVFADQSVTGGDKVTRSYAPASADQEAIKINIFCTEREDCLFITDEAVRKCGTLTIDLRGSYKGPKRRELQLSMQFGDTEVKVDALDVATGKKVEARVDFLNN